MDKEQKAAEVAELAESLKGADTIFAVDYRGISVTGSAELRRRLVEADAVFRVVKNRLAKRAVADAGTEGIDELLIGPTALTLVNGDAVIAAKAISTFARQNRVLEYKGGLMDGAPLDRDAFATIARLPGLEALRGQLVGVAASPITGLVRGLGSMMSGLALALGQIAEQGLVAGEAPAEDESAGKPEAAAAEGEAPEQAEEPAAEAESELPAEAAAAEQRADEGPAEEPAADRPEQAAEELAGEPESEVAAEAEEAAAEESSDDESRPEEPAADAEAEGSEQ
jgi:large subunit ribosomal protein L10